MNRRAFIKEAALLGAAAVVVPKVLFAKETPPFNTLNAKFKAHWKSLPSRYTHKIYSTGAPWTTEQQKNRSLALSRAIWGRT